MTKRTFVLLVVFWAVAFELGYELAKFLADNGMFANHHYIQLIIVYYFIMGVFGYWLDAQRKKLQK